MENIILDSNILLDDPNSIYQFGDARVILLSTVIEEIDSKKKEQNELGRNARQVTRNIMELMKGNEGKTSTGIPLENGGTLQIELNHRNPEIMEGKFLSDNNDNKILTVVMNIKKEAEDGLSKEKRFKLDEILERFKKGEINYDEYWIKYEDISGFTHTIVSNDSIVNIKADMLYLKHEQYQKDRIKNIDEIHKGYHSIVVPQEIINKFYKEKEVSIEELEPYLRESLGINENKSVHDKVFVQDFLKLKTSENESYKAVGRITTPNGIKKLTQLVIIEEMEEAKKNNVPWAAPFGLQPKNLEQKMLMEVLLDPNVDLVIALGPAGTGKTIITLACGLQMIENDHTYNKMIASRPIIPMGKDIGYLPGEKDEKLRAWMQPIYDNLEYLMNLNNNEDEKITSERVAQEMQKLNVELEAMTYMRGRTLAKSFNYLDEFQNGTTHEGKSVLTRAGINSKMVLSGDINQIDNPYLDSTNNALVYIIERMKQEKNVAIVYLGKTERSPLAEQAARLL